jgi:hypothetical protein
MIILVSNGVRDEKKLQRNVLPGSACVRWLDFKRML